MRRSSVLSLLILMLAVLACRCSESGDSPADDGRSVRIVSLSPAISRTLIDFSLADAIVGRTPFCELLDPQIPVVGDLLNLDYERLVRLRPTHVLVQPPAMGVDRRLVELAEQHDWTLAQWHIDTLEDVKTMVAELPEALDDDSLIERAVELELAIDDALRPSEVLWQGTTLLVASTDPVGVFGTGTYLHDVIAALGATNAVALANYPQLTLEDVTRLDPEAIILVRPGAPESLEPGAALRALASLDISAVRDGRIALLSHPDAFLPSTGIIGMADELRTILDQFRGLPRANPDGGGL